MNLSVLNISSRENDDPDYADYWLELAHLDSGIRWEVPLSKKKAASIKEFLPKDIQAKIPEVEAKHWIRGGKKKNQQN